MFRISAGRLRKGGMMFHRSECCGSELTTVHRGLIRCRRWEEADEPQDQVGGSEG